MVFHLGLLDLIYLGPCQPGGCSEPVVHSATHSDRLGQMTTCSVLSRERGRCLDATSPGDLCGQSSQQFMLCSQPVPLLSWDSPWDSEAMTPPFTDGMCVCVSGGRPLGTIPAWLVSHTMFCSKSLECPGTQSSAPWGRRWCHRLDLIAGQVFSFIPAWDSAGSQLPASARPSSSVSVLALAATSLQLGAEGFPGEAPLAGLLRGPRANLFKLDHPPPQLPFITGSLECAPPPPLGGLRSTGNRVLRTLETWTGWGLPAALTPALFSGSGLHRVGPLLSVWQN